MEIQRLFAHFMRQVDEGTIEIYNEFSLQHEFGMFLRLNLQPQKVQFERNIAHFGLDKPDFAKREIDICAYIDPASPSLAVELKYPRNGQYPEQLFSFCKDIVFLEQLRRAGFENCIFAAVVEDRPFYEGRQFGIYAPFRGGSSLEGEVVKPTGKKDSRLLITGSYSIEWHRIADGKRYLVVEV